MFGAPSTHDAGAIAGIWQVPPAAPSGFDGRASCSPPTPTRCSRGCRRPMQPLVDWVEQGKAPAAVTASVRGPGNGAGANADLPPSWSPGRTRPLCPYPAVARRTGEGDLESASAFTSH